MLDFRQRVQILSYYAYHMSVCCNLILNYYIYIYIYILSDRLQHTEDYVTVPGTAHTNLRETHPHTSPG